MLRGPCQDGQEQGPGWCQDIRAAGLEQGRGQNHFETCVGTGMERGPDGGAALLEAPAAALSSRTQNVTSTHPTQLSHEQCGASQAGVPWRLLPWRQLLAPASGPGEGGAGQEASGASASFSDGRACYRGHACSWTESGWEPVFPAVCDFTHRVLPLMNWCHAAAGCF